MHAAASNSEDRRKQTQATRRRPVESRLQVYVASRDNEHVSRGPLRRARCGVCFCNGLVHELLAPLAVQRRAPKDYETVAIPAKPLSHADCSKIRFGQELGTVGF